MKGAWWVDFRYEGQRFRKKSPVDNKRGAEEYERKLRQQLLDGTYQREEVPTFREWFNGRFWTEWVIGRKNKPSEVESKRSIFKHHLDRAFGGQRLDQIGTAQVAAFRARLVAEGKLSDKRMNNILTVLSKALRYAVEVEMIEKAPKVGLFKLEQGEVVFWEFDTYAQLLDAAVVEGPMWYAAVCLAGEAGLRVGEVRALEWTEVDLIGRTITISQQRRKGIEGTPKGRTRRVVPMTPVLYDALRRLEVLRRGYVVRNPDGSPLTDGQTTHAIYRMCDRAGLPQREHPKRSWHVLRHTFGTHAALFGANPWRLQAWLGHKRIDETQRYVHVAEAHHREWPAEVIAAANRERDLDRRIIAMLGARTSGGLKTLSAQVTWPGHQVGTNESGNPLGAENY
jgi:integrase